MSCQYFALCDNEAIGVIINPVLGPVPCCQRCADKLDLTLVFDRENPHAELLPDPPAGWANQYQHIVMLARWCADNHYSADSVAYAVEKPGKYVDEYKIALYDLEQELLKEQS